MTIRPASARDRIALLRRQRGFSLLELVVTLSIIATLAAIAAPRYHGSIARHQLDLAAARIVADLDFARRRAVVGGVPVTVRFRTGSGGYVILGVPDADRGRGNTAVELSEAPYRVELKSADFDGQADVVFDALGQPASGGTVVIGRGSAMRTIRLDVSSRRGVIE